MDRSTTAIPAFFRLLEHPVNVNNIRESLSIILEGYLKNLKYNKYPEANDLSKAAIFIQNATLIYSDNVDDLFTLVTDLNKALYHFKVHAVAAPPTPSTASVTSSEHSNHLDDDDEQITASRTKKQSRKKIEEQDNDPTDIIESWTSDIIEEVEDQIPSEQADQHFELFSDQDCEVETVLAQSDAFESTASFVHRDDVHRDKSKDFSKREFRILSQINDEGYISSDFNIFDSKRSKRYNSIATGTVDLIEVNDLNESINRDVLLEPTSIVHSIESREIIQDDDIEQEISPNKRLDLNKKPDDEFYNLKVGLVTSDKEEYFRVSLHFLDEYSKKHMRKSMWYKYAVYRDIHYYDHLKLNDAVSIHGSKPHPIDNETSKFYPDPDVCFEGFQTLFDADWYGWPMEEDPIDKQDSPMEISNTDVVPDMDESEYVQDVEQIPKPNFGDAKNKFTKKASKWIEVWKPIVQRTTNAKKFDINEYGDKVIEAINMNSNISKDSPEKVLEPSPKSLEDILEGQSFEEASKIFLATLVLASNGNLELQKTSTDPLAVNKCNVKLLSSERHHEKFHQDIALCARAPESRKRKK